MDRNFNFKSLKKIAEDDMMREGKKSMDVARNVMAELEDIIIDEINKIIIESLKQNETFVEINICRLQCLNNKEDLNMDVYYFIKLHICRIYKEKGFPIDTGTFNRYAFYVFSSKRALWRNKLSLFF